MTVLAELKKMMYVDLNIYTAMTPQECARALIRLQYRMQRYTQQIDKLLQNNDYFFNQYMAMIRSKYIILVNHSSIDTLVAYARTSERGDFSPYQILFNLLIKYRKHSIKFVQKISAELQKICDRLEQEEAEQMTVVREIELKRELESQIPQQEPLAMNTSTFQDQEMSAQQNSEISIQDHGSPIKHEDERQDIICLLDIKVEGFPAILFRSVDAGPNTFAPFRYGFDVMYLNRSSSAQLRPQ